MIKHNIKKVTETIIGDTLRYIIMVRASTMTIVDDCLYIIIALLSSTPGVAVRWFAPEPPPPGESRIVRGNSENLHLSSLIPKQFSSECNINRIANN
jgi:hypothetical protein